MCVHVYVAGDVVRRAETKLELRLLLGIEPIMDEPYAAVWEDDDCLCPCAIEATAAAAGMTLFRDDDGGYTMTPNVRINLPVEA